MSIELLNKALTRIYARTDLSADTYAALGQIYHSIGNSTNAIKNFQKAIEIMPQNHNYRHELGRIYIDIGDWANASEQMEWLIKNSGYEAGELTYLGLINLWQDNSKKALELFQQDLKQGHRDAFIYHNIGVAMNRLGYYVRSQVYLDTARMQTQPKSKGNLLILFSSIENSADMDDFEGEYYYANLIIDAYPLTTITGTLEELETKYDSPPIDFNVVNESIAAFLKSEVEF